MSENPDLLPSDVDLSQGNPADLGHPWSCGLTHFFGSVIDRLGRRERDSRTAVKGNSDFVERSSGMTWRFAALGDRSMVGQCPLEAFIQVRILVAQPKLLG